MSRNRWKLRDTGQPFICKYSIAGENRPADPYSNCQVPRNHGKDKREHEVLCHPSGVEQALLSYRTPDGETLIHEPGAGMNASVGLLRGKAANEAGWASYRSEHSAVLFADHIHHVCWSSWRASSLECFLGDFVRFCLWFQRPARHGECIGDAVWTIILCKGVPHAGDTHPESSASTISLECSLRGNMVLHWEYPHIAWPEQGHSNWGGRIQQMDDP